MQSLVVESSLPGVIALVNTSQVARAAERQPTSTFFAVGYSPWGPVGVPTIVTSWDDYVRQFGGFDANSLMDDSVYGFFNHFGGTQSVISRVVGAAAAKATKTINDRAVTPLPTLKADALYPSPYTIKVTVEAGTTANTVKLTFRCVELNRKEVFDNIKMDADSMAIINDVRTGSKLVRVTNLGSATAAPNNLPALTAETNLTGGTDDVGGISASDYIGTDDGAGTKTGLTAFTDLELGTGQVAIPGITTTPVHAALVAHAEAYKRIALLDPPFGSDKAAVAGIRALYGSYRAVLAWPWVQVLDYSGSGLMKYVAPSAFIAGACAQADRTVGTHRSIGNTSIPAALDVERYSTTQPQVDDNAHEYLNARDVVVIRPFPGEGVKIYGDRVLTADPRVTALHEARLLNLFYHSGRQGYRYAVFQTIDAQGKFFRDLVATGVNFLQPFYEVGALYGETPEEAFSVVADTSNNPRSEIDAGRVHVRWGVRFSQRGEQIFLNIENVRLFQNLSVLAS